MGPTLRNIFFAVVLLLASGFLAWAGDESAARSSADPWLLYQEGRYPEVINRLAKTAVLEYDQALYLGLSYLRTGNREGAIRAWKHAVGADRGGEGARRVAPFVTLLQRDATRQHARTLIRREASRSTKPPDTTIAILPLRSPGLRAADPLSKGLIEMVIADLSQVPSLTVIPRDLMETLWEELGFEQPDAGDLKTAARVGRLLGAGTVATGSVVDLDSERMLVDITIARAKDGALLVSPGVAASVPTFYSVEKALVVKILCSLKRCPDRLEPRTQASLKLVHTRSYPAFRLWSQGLDHRDHGRYRDAARSFVLAVQEDPQFRLARTALLETPWFPVDVPTMVAGAEALMVEEQAFRASERIGSATAPPEHGVSSLALPPIVQTPVTLVPVNIQVRFP